jgi:hypothetical protein
MTSQSSPLTHSGNFQCASKRLSDYEPLAKICSSFVLELFSPESAASLKPSPYDSLSYFIAVAFSQSQLPDANALAALTLLQRLKSHHPTRILSSPPKCREAERLFLSSYIAATKVLSDDRYRLQFWVAVGQNKFTTDELAQMEKEFFEELEWDVRIDDATLAIYQLLVERRKQVTEKKDHDSQDDQKKPRSGSFDSTASTESSQSTSSSNWSSSGGTASSPSSSIPSTPGDPAISDPVIAAGLLRVKESEQSLACLDQRIEELQKKFDLLVSNTPCRKQARSPNHGTRHMIKEKLWHAFH